MAIKTMINNDTYNDNQSMDFKNIIASKDIQISQLRAELKNQRLIIDTLQKANSDSNLNDNEIPNEIHLTKTEKKIFLALKDHKFCSFSMIQRALYEDGKTLATYTNICVMLSYLRKKLKSKNILIKVRPRVGWFIVSNENNFNDNK